MGYVLDPWELIERYHERYVDACRAFLEKLLAESGAQGYVLGLSGGLDSSTLAVLLRRTLGRDRVLALILPDKESPYEDVVDAVELAEAHDIRFAVIDITPSVESLLRHGSFSYESSDPVVRGNVKARVRAVLLYLFANAYRMLVAGSTDRSEYLLGYFTKWGDIAADVHPLLPLFKTQVRVLARKLEVPERIVSKPSSPSFWVGQRAEDEIGAPYETVDRVLHLAIDRQMPLDEIAKRLGVELRLVERIWAMVERSRHKRIIVRAPPNPFYAIIASSELMGKGPEAE